MSDNSFFFHSQSYFIHGSVRDLDKFIFSQTLLIPYSHTHMDEERGWGEFDSGVCFQVDMPVAGLDTDKGCHEGSKVVICFAVISTHHFELNKGQLWINHFEFHGFLPNWIESIL